MSKLDYFTFTDISGAGNGWLLVVTATSLADARAYVKAWHGGGRYVGVHTPSRTDYDSMICGAVTDEARAVISQRLASSLEAE